MLPYYPVISILAAFILLIFLIIAIILLAPFRLSLDVGKEGPSVWGKISLAWLGFTLKKMVISFSSAEDLLAFIQKEGDREEKHITDERRANLKDKAVRKIIELSGKKDREQEGRKQDEVILSEIDGETECGTKNAIHHPSIRSLIDVVPALAKILWNLLRSINFDISTCRLSFGLNDPAQTAIISGYLWFLTSAIGKSPTGMIIEPWFDGERLEGKLEAKIEARLLSPVLAAIRALRIKEIRQLLKEMLGWT